MMMFAGGTPTGERLAERLQERLAKMDAASGQSYRDVKPWDLIVITDGCPSMLPLLDRPCLYYY
jgi:uncharacterized protein YegL